MSMKPIHCHAFCTSTANIYQKNNKWCEKYSDKSLRYLHILRVQQAPKYNAQKEIDERKKTIKY